MSSSATHHHRKKERAEQANRAEQQRQEEVQHNARSRAATSPNLVAAMFTRARDVSVSPQPQGQPLSSDSSASTSSASTSIAVVGGHYLTADGSGPRLMHASDETEMSRRATTPMNMAVSDSSVLRRIGIADVARGVHCGICQDLFDNDADLFKHMLQTHQEQVAADVKFSSNGAILRSRASEPTLSASAPDTREAAKKRPKRRFKCLTSNCSAKFATEIELRQHIDETHAKHSLASLAFGPPKKPVTKADLLGK